MIDLSIIIVNWNTKQLLRQCLWSIYKTTRDVTFEVYVVDNGSIDGSIEMVNKLFTQVKLIKNSQNQGFARANNKAIRRTLGRYILLLNSDTVVLGRALDKMVAFLDEYREAGVVGCKLINKDGTIQLSASWFSTLATIILGGQIMPRALAKVLGVKKFPGQNFLTDKDHKIIQEVDWVKGACMLVRREIINEAGLLDENLFMYGEEVEWCFRIKKAGWKIFYFPDSRIIHYEGGSAKEQRKISMYRIAFAGRYIYHKHHNTFLSLLYDLITITMTMIKLPLWGFLLLINPYKHKASANLYYHFGVLRSIFCLNSKIFE